MLSDKKIKKETHFVCRSSFANSIRYRIILQRLIIGCTLKLSTRISQCYDFANSGECPRDLVHFCTKQALYFLTKRGLWDVGRCKSGTDMRILPRRCLFDLGLTSLLTIFQSYRDGVWMWHRAQCSLLECCLTEISRPGHFDMIFHQITLYWHWADQF